MAAKTFAAGDELDWIMSRYPCAEWNGGASGRIAACAAVMTLACLSLPAQARNTEASSPQRPVVPTMLPPVAAKANKPAIARPVPQTETSRPRPIVAARTVLVPVLGREGPAAAQNQKVVNTTAPVKHSERPNPSPQAIAAPIHNQTGLRQVAINASEPAFTPGVRTADVAGFQKIGAPYQVGGVWYVPAHEPDYDETGIASWYGNEFHGRPTANGETFDMNVVSGAHPTLPIPSLVEVSNLANGRSLIVRVNDRGPFVGNRLIDLSARGAQLLGFASQGHTNVRVRYVGAADAARVVTPQSLTPPVRLASNAKATRPLNNAQQAFEPNMAARHANTERSDGQAFVQVGSFSIEANAQRLAEQAAGLGPIRVVEATSASGASLYRVVLGPVANRAQAQAKVDLLNESGFSDAQVMASLN